MKKGKVVNTSGKRKTAIARATVQGGKGRIRVNKVPLEVYEPEIARYKIFEPVNMIGKRKTQVDVDVSVEGGGVMGQADAIRTAIARGLVEYFESGEIKEMFKQYDRSLLVNDPRRKLPKTPQGRGARKKRQKSYR